MMILEAQGVALPPEPTCEVYVAALGEAAQEKAFQLVHEMRQASISAQGDICGRSLKAQMKYADKIGAQFTLVLGEDELSSQKAQLKHMKTGEKFDVRLDGNFLHDYVTAQASGCLEQTAPGEPV